MKSSEVFVFPCISRTGGYALDAKLLSEKNLSNIIKCVTDKKSFVINEDLQNLEFVLDGYYFKLSKKLSGTQYAYLSKKDDVLNGDSGEDFKGLVVSETKPEAGTEYLSLCVNDEIPSESKVKFVLSKIDCGEVTI